MCPTTFCGLNDERSPCPPLGVVPRFHHQAANYDAHDRQPSQTQSNLSLLILTRVAACAITSHGTSDAQEGKKQKTKDPLPR